MKGLVEGDKVSISFRGPVERLTEILSGLPGIAVVDLNDNHAELITSNAATALPSMVEKLCMNGFTISEVRIREVTLDEIFIKLTGRRISDEPGRIKEVMSMRRMIRGSG